MRKYIGIPVLLLLLAGCARKEVIPEEASKPVLSSISVLEKDLVLLQGGSCELNFTVNSPSYSFNYDVTSSECQVLLRKPGGLLPTGVRIASVAAGQLPGTYTALLADTGGDTAYDENVSLCIQISPVGGAYVSSAAFHVKSERKQPETYTQTGLPVVYVDTEARAPIVSKEEYVAASMYILGEGGQEDLQPVTCSVRGRGNTTWSWPKKPYLVKLDEKTSVLDMPKHKRWILLANFMDRTLMRNLVSMKLSSMTSLAWTPRCRPVELVLNGRHVGSYLLIEQVRVDKNRVNITEMKAEDNSGDAVTGGYLLELDFHYDNEVQWVDAHGGSFQWGQESGIPFGVKYPDPEDLTSAQLDYIKGYIAKAASTLYGEQFTDPSEGYAAYLDVDSFIDYWLVYELMCNHELGNPGSVHMHKDRGGKLVAGPCWDFDWGILSFYTSAGETQLVNRNAIWYGRLFQDPVFAEKVKARFNELLPQLQTIPDYMDQCEALLTESAKLNFKMWNPAEDRSMNGGHIINGDENLSFHDAVQRLKHNYEKHLQVMQEKL